VPHQRPSAGDEIPAGSEVIEVRVGELKQLFNAIDPSPFREKDLGPKAEEFIVQLGGRARPRRAGSRWSSTSTDPLI
jgi:hypothetical protein